MHIHAGDHFTVSGLTGRCGNDCLQLQCCEIIDVAKRATTSLESISQPVLVLQELRCAALALSEPINLFKVTRRRTCRDSQFNGELVTAQKLSSKQEAFGSAESRLSFANALGAGQRYGLRTEDCYVVFGQGMVDRGTR